MSDDGSFVPNDLGERVGNDRLVVTKNPPQEERLPQLAERILQGEIGGKVVWGSGQSRRSRLLQNDLQHGGLPFQESSLEIGVF